MTTKHKVLVSALAVATAFVLSTSAASANGGQHPMYRSGDTTVKNMNSATVINTVKVEAETGENDANGAGAGNGGNGGDARSYGHGRTVGGDGGNGGHGGDGGYIETGDAMATSFITNKVNYNKTKVKADCGCKGDLKVKNRNNATVVNNVEAEAETGENDADGGEGSRGGEGGDAQNGKHYRGYWWWWYGGGNAVAGDAGNGGHGGDGGVIFTGDASAYSEITNKVNRNYTKVKRTGSSLPYHPMP